MHFNRSQGSSEYREQTEQLFPLDFDQIRTENIQWKQGPLPTCYMSRGRLLSDLLKQYFFITLFRTKCRSLVAENESRIAAMTSAKKNMKERIEVLERTYKRVRQDSITDEIRDIT